jgi:hypothetical protein
LSVTIGGHGPERLSRQQKRLLHEIACIISSSRQAAAQTVQPLVMCVEQLCQTLCRFSDRRAQ